jgi:L-alanine-DL-glutamate epimerase-like enolase superfamily enzyme
MLTVTPVRYALKAPLPTAWGELTHRELLHVRLAYADDDWGEGEAAPLEPYDGVSLAAVSAALEVYAAIAADVGPEDLLAACAAERPLPQALAAIDLALWDRAARRAATPLARLIHPGAAASVPVNATIGAEDRAGAAAAAATAARAGFRCLKVKVGIGDDAGRVAAVRAAVGPEIAIRVDANGAWATPAEALANLRVLAPMDIELCEEPVHGVEALRAVRADSSVAIAMDETDAPGSGAADAVCLKITRGGITAVLRGAAQARATGALVYLASTYDGPLGIAAGVHTAAALLATGPLAPCGLATLDGLAGVEDPFAPKSGMVRLNFT